LPCRHSSTVCAALSRGSSPGAVAKILPSRPAVAVPEASARRRCGAPMWWPHCGTTSA
jgi:hypothetical protein